MKHLIRFTVALAALIASLCAFICVLERMCTRMTLSPEEPEKVEKIQFDLEID